MHCLFSKNEVQASKNLGDGAVAEALQRADSQQRSVLRHSIRQTGGCGGDVRAVTVAVLTHSAALERGEDLASAAADGAVPVTELLVRHVDALQVHPTFSNLLDFKSLKTHNPYFENFALLYIQNPK